MRVHSASHVAPVSSLPPVAHPTPKVPAAHAAKTHLHP